MNFHKLRSIIRIAVPAIAESLAAVVVTSVDTKLVSSMGPQAISGISFTSQPKLMVFSVFFALGTALNVFVAQAYGQKDRDAANAYLKSILKITVILSLVLGIVMSAAARPIMELCNRQPDTVHYSTTFFRIVMGLMVFHNVSVVLNGALRGIGENRITLISSLAMGLVDIVFNYLLIEGRFGFPRLGGCRQCHCNGSGHGSRLPDQLSGNLKKEGVPESERHLLLFPAQKQGKNGDHPHQGRRYRAGESVYTDRFSGLQHHQFLSGILPDGCVFRGYDPV